MNARTVTVWDGKVRIRVQSRGSGPALVFFHGPWGLTWDPFLDELAKSFTVHAPEHPGTTADSPDDAGVLDGLWDLLLCYDEMLTGLGLDRAALVGHSFGGMVAAELAAQQPTRASRLALIAPLGFWRDSDPVVNWMAVDPARLSEYVFRDAKGAAAQQMFALADPEARVRLMWAMGTTGKFIWPIPDKGLKKRIHRVTAPTLLIWGKEDRLVPPVYADEFARRLPEAQTQTVEGAGHMPHLERPETVARMVRDFVMAAPRRPPQAESVR
jgi:pimeloyl-ACP methyl ester carboxylesterase